MLEINLDALNKEDLEYVWTILRLFNDGILSHDYTVKAISMVTRVTRYNEIPMKECPIEQWRELLEV